MIFISFAPSSLPNTTPPPPTHLHPYSVGKMTNTVGHTYLATYLSNVLGLSDFGIFTASSRCLSFCLLLHHLAKAGRAHNTSWVLSSAQSTFCLFLGVRFSESEKSLSSTGGHSMRYSLSFTFCMFVGFVCTGQSKVHWIRHLECLDSFQLHSSPPRLSCNFSAVLEGVGTKRRPETRNNKICGFHRI